mgnify:CR=1 FL=1
MWRQSDALCLAGSRQVRLLTLRCGEQNRALPRAVQSQESNVPPGYGVGWRSPPGLVESVGIHIGWAGRRLGVGEQSPSLCDAPPTQPGYPERLREVAPGRAQVSGPVDRVSAFPYRLKVTHG